MAQINPELFWVGTSPAALIAWRSLVPGSTVAACTDGVAAEPSCNTTPMHTWPSAAPAEMDKASAVRLPTDKVRATRMPVFERIRMISARVSGRTDDGDQPGSEGGVHSCSLPGLSPETPNTRGHTEPQSTCLDRWELCCLSGIPAARLTSAVSRSRLRTSAGISPASPFGQLLQVPWRRSHRNTGARINERDHMDGLALGVSL